MINFFSLFFSDWKKLIICLIIIWENIIIKHKVLYKACIRVEPIIFVSVAQHFTN